MNTLPLRHIVCPIDLSGQFRTALEHAMAVARARNAELRALHVVPSEGPASPGGLASSGRLTSMEQLREMLTEVDPAYDRIGAAVRHGDPATEILRFARTTPSDLIVMGAPGADRPERPIGPVTSVVVARSDCPVLTVPSHASMSNGGLFTRILCAVDLAPSSTPVIRQALSLAWETRGQLTFVCVTPDDDPASRSHTRETLLAAVPPEATSWCEIEVIVTNGSPGAEILRFTHEHRPDVVIIGAPRRWTSAAHAVLAESLCPVLVAHEARSLPWPASRTDHSTGAVATNPGIHRSKSPQ